MIGVVHEAPDEDEDASEEEKKQYSVVHDVTLDQLHDITKQFYRKVSAPVPQINEGTSYSELYKPNKLLDVDRYSAHKSQLDRSFE
jgi:hypothetical protein